MDDEFSQLEKDLTKAGNMFDGHVTIGSMQEQMKVIKNFLVEEDKKWARQQPHNAQ